MRKRIRMSAQSQLPDIKGKDTGFRFHRTTPILRKTSINVPSLIDQPNTEGSQENRECQQRGLVGCSRARNPKSGSQHPYRMYLVQRRRFSFPYEGHSQLLVSKEGGFVDVRVSR